jgi:glycosyltransferase involved in cell wall biosynthesis
MPRESESSDKVSVIVTTKNSASTLESCLSSIKRQTYHNVELVVVDNFSEDSTQAIAKRFADVFVLAGPERSSQRNIGATLATGEYLLFVDSDMMLSDDLVNSCVEAIQLGAFGALYIPEVILGQGIWIRVRNFERSFYVGGAIDAVRFVKRDVFRGVGAFDEDLTGVEDWDLDKRIRNVATVGIAPACLFHVEGRFRISRYLHKKRYYSSWFARYVEKYGSEDPDVKRQLGVYYRAIGVFTEGGKWKQLIRHPFESLLMFYLRLLVGVVYLTSGRSRGDARTEPQSSHSQSSCR